MAAKRKNMSSSDHGRGMVSAGPLRVAITRSSPHPMWQRSIPDLRILRVARERWGAGSGISYGRSQVAIWLQLQHGRLRLDHQGGSLRGGPGDCLAVPAGVPYRFWVEGRRDAEHWIMNCDGASCLRWWQHLGRQEPAVLHVARRGEAEWLCERILDHLGSERSSDRWTACCYMQAYHSLIAADQEWRPADGGAAAELAARCRDLVAGRGLELGSVVELADELGVGPDYLARCCRQLGLPSPGDQLRLVRMQRAAALLSDGMRQVGSIADELGFSDVFAFSKAFKRYAGLSPRAWRRHFADLAPLAITPPPAPG